MFPNDLARSYDGSQNFAQFRCDIVLGSDFNFCYCKFTNWWDIAFKLQK